MLEFFTAVPERALAVAVLLAAISTGCNRAEGGGEKKLEPPVPVETATVTAEDAVLEVLATGTVEARSDVTVVAQSPGKVKKVLFELGDDVAEGQVLVKLDGKMQKLVVQQARAQFDQGAAARDMATLNLERLRKLFDQGNVSQTEMDKATMESKAAIAACTMAEVAVDQAKQALSYTTVKAPIAGKVTLRLVTRGQMVAPGTPLAQVTDLGSLKVVVGLTEREVADLAVGQQVQINGAVNPEVTCTGRIAGIGVKAMGPTRAFPVEIWIDEPPEHLNPGMTVNLRIAIERLTGALIVHSNDLFEKDGISWAWICVDGRAARRDVTPGRSIDERIVVTAGLAAGDCLVVKGGDLLHQGSILRVPGSADKCCGASP